MSVDAAPPPPPPSPPPDFPGSDQPVTDTGRAPPEETSPASTDTNAETGDPGTADVPMPGGQATPDLGDGETGGQAAGAGPDGPGAGEPDDSGAGAVASGADQPDAANEVVSGADQPDAANSGAVDADGAATGSGGSGTPGGSQDLDPADVPVTDDGQAAPGLGDGEAITQVAGAGPDDPGAGEDASGADQLDVADDAQGYDAMVPDAAANDGAPDLDAVDSGGLGTSDGSQELDPADVPVTDDGQAVSGQGSDEPGDWADPGAGDDASGAGQPDVADADRVSGDLVPEAAAEDGAADPDAAGSDGSGIFESSGDLDPADIPVTDDGQIAEAGPDNSGADLHGADQSDVANGTAELNDASSHQFGAAAADENSDATAKDGIADQDAADSDGSGAFGSSQNLDPADVPVTDDGQAAEAEPADLDAAESDQPNVVGADEVSDDVAANPTEDGPADLDAAGSDGSGFFDGSKPDLEPTAVPAAENAQDNAAPDTVQDTEIPDDNQSADGPANSNRSTGPDTPGKPDQPDKAMDSAKAIELDTNAGSAYYGLNDAKMRNAAQSVKPEAGFYTVDMHGNSSSVEFKNQDGIDERLTAGQLASVIKNNDSWNGEPVRLFSCSTGADPAGGGKSFGQQLANSLGVEVKAPTTIVSQDRQGNPVLIGGGMWRTFKPEK